VGTQCRAVNASCWGEEGSVWKSIGQRGVTRDREHGIPAYGQMGRESNEK
jgi:hypothetical protein